MDFLYQRLQQNAAAWRDECPAIAEILDYARRATG
jgi:hypothetical protein